MLLKAESARKCTLRTAQARRSADGAVSSARKCTLKNSAGKILNRTYLRHYLSGFSTPKKERARPDATLNAPTIGGDVLDADALPAVRACWQKKDAV